MPRSKYTIHHPNIDHLLYFYIDLYYCQIEEDPTIRVIEKKHLQTIENIDTLYRAALDRNPQFDKEKYQEDFITKIEILTQAFANKKKADEKLQQRQLLATKTHEDAANKRKLLGAHGIHT